MAATPVDEDLAKVNLADAPPPPPGAGGFSFAAAPVGGAPAGGFSFNLAPPAAPGAGGGDDDEEDEEEDDEMAGPPLPKEVLQRVLGLKALEEQREAQMKAYLVERAALEQKYKALIDPIYGERSKIVRGELEPALSEEDRATVEQAGTTTDEADGPIVGVPDFWLSALGRNEAFEHFLEEPDVAALKYLVDVRCADFEDLTGFTVEFEFAENPFFSDSVLTKSYAIPNLVDANGQPELEKITGCEIAWKDAKDNLCVHEVKKKQKSKRGKNAGQTRVVAKLEDKPSFFHFFKSIKLPSADDDDEDEGDGEEFDDAARDKIDNDVELAFALRNQIVPHAVLWFTGEACDDDDDEDYDYDDEEGSDDEED